MEFIRENSFEHFLGEKVLLYGETHTKKTYYTSKFVKFLLEKKKYRPNKITILDFAPELQKIKGLEIGGKIKDYYEKSLKCNYLTISGKIIPPRLTAENKRELQRIAKQNYNKTSAALKRYKDAPTKIVIMNDISIHLHIGDPMEILEVIDQSKTFFGNSYYGTSISNDFSRDFSLREKERVEILANKITKSYHSDEFI